MTKSAKGNSLVNVGGYRFSLKKNRPKGPKQRWRCTSHDRFPPYQVLETIRGNQLICLGGFRFSRKKDKRTSHSPKLRWRCATHHKSGCTATLYTMEDNIVSIKNVHNHRPPREYHRAASKLQVNP
ncbi:unnamed protein product, partial [Iphiclides podalirius]